MMCIEIQMFLVSTSIPNATMVHYRILFGGLQGWDDSSLIQFSVFGSRFDLFVTLFTSMMTIMHTF